MTTFWLCLLFFVSGFAALLFENLWFYQAGLTLGNSIWASSLVLTGFMGGLALGNGLAVWVAKRVRRPIRVYAFLELTIGVAGLALVFGFPLLTPVLADVFAPLLDTWLIQPLRLFSALLLLLVPATAMGATLPVLVRAVSGHDPQFGRVLGRLYGWNTLGAVAGAVAGDIFFIEHLGVRGTGLLAFGLDVVAAGAALALAHSVEVPATPPSSVRAGLSGRARVALVVAASAGFTLLALEVVWFRFLQLFVRATSTSFAVLLGVVLAGIGIGGLIASLVAGRVKRPEQHLPAVAATAAATTVFLYGRFSSGPEIVSILDTAGLAIALMLPVSVLSALMFTLLGELVHREVGGEAESAGWLTLANTTGAAAGSLAAGFLLLPRFGVENSLWLLSGIYVACAFLLWWVGIRPEARIGRALFGLSALGAALAMLYFPVGHMEHRHIAGAIQPFERADKARPIAIREGLTETLVYLQAERFGEPFWHRMVTNGYSMSGTESFSERYMKIFVALPVALRPEPRSALLISFGVGSTAKALTETPSLETIDIADISPDVLELGRLVHPPGEYPLDDPRVDVHVEDGRYFLQTTSRRFDLITGEPPPPELAGVISLYTQEYFELIHDRLNPGGLVSYWLPVFSFSEEDALVIIRGFCAVFEDCTLWGGTRMDWTLVGSKPRSSEEPPLTVAGFEAQWRDPKRAAVLRDLGLERPELMATLFMAGPKQLAELTQGVPPLVDDWPKRFSEDIADATTAFQTFAPWMEARVTRRNFLRSDWVRQNLPPELRSAGAEAFDTQTLVDRALFLPLGQPVDLGLLHELRGEHALPTVRLWVLRSDYRKQRAAKAAVAKGRSGPAISMELGIGALARAEYAEALAHLRAARTPAGQPFAPLQELYAACMAGESVDVEGTLRPLAAATQKTSQVAEYRGFFSEVCGDPGRGPSTDGWSGLGGPLD